MVSHRPQGGTYDKSNNFLEFKGDLCNVFYVVIVNIDVVSMILHKINILFEILKYTLHNWSRNMRYCSKKSSNFIKTS